eukprot:256023-Alexandrium_andersonii.AAC.1
MSSPQLVVLGLACTFVQSCVPHEHCLSPRHMTGVANWFSAPIAVHHAIAMMFVSCCCWKWPASGKKWVR